MYIENTEEILRKTEEELNIFQKYLTIQKEKKMIVFENYNVIIMNSLRTHLLEWETLLNEVTKNSENVEQNIHNLEELIARAKEINKLLLEIQFRKTRNEEYNDVLNNLNNKYEEYLPIKTQVIDVILANTKEVEEFNKRVISTVKKNIYEEDLLKPKIINEEEKAQKNLSNVYISQKIEEEFKTDIQTDDLKDNRVLLISEKTNKVYLPYLISDLKRELKENKRYNTIEELIENEYVLDLDIFKNSMFSRFKEAYKLIKRKEKGSIINATELGLELMFNYSLNPAVIAACKNEDELDIYLDCLEENELDSFKIFDVKFEVSPTAILVNTKESNYYA